MAYIQYLNAYGDWVCTERMTRARAAVEVATFPEYMEAHVRVCGPL